MVETLTFSWLLKRKCAPPVGEVILGHEEVVRRNESYIPLHIVFDLGLQLRPSSHLHQCTVVLQVFKSCKIPHLRTVLTKCLVVNSSYLSLCIYISLLVGPTLKSKFKHP